MNTLYHFLDTKLSLKQEFIVGQDTYMYNDMSNYLKRMSRLDEFITSGVNANRPSWLEKGKMFSFFAGPWIIREEEGVSVRYTRVIEIFECIAPDKVFYVDYFPVEIHEANMSNGIIMENTIVLPIRPIMHNMLMMSGSVYDNALYVIDKKEQVSEERWVDVFRASQDVLSMMAEEIMKKEQKEK